MVQLPGGPALTAFHPVLKNGTWFFPLNIRGMEIAELGDGELVDLMLEDGSKSFEMGGFDVAAWGHGSTNPDLNPVLGHAFFGCPKAICKAFGQHPGWAKGVVSVPAGGMRVVRDPVSNLISTMQI